MKTRLILSWVLIVPVALLFALTAFSKLGGMQDQMFIDWGYQPWFANVIGVIEGIGAILLLLPRTRRWAVYGLSVVMIGAAITHITNAEWPGILRPAIFAGAMWGSLYLRSKGREEHSESDTPLV